MPRSKATTTGEIHWMLRPDHKIFAFFVEWHRSKPESPRYAIRYVMTEPRDV